MNKNKLVAALMLILLLLSLFCLYLVATQKIDTIETTSNSNTQKDIPAQRDADISFLLIMGLAGAGIAVSRLVASKHL